MARRTARGAGTLAVGRKSPIELGAVVTVCAGRRFLLTARGRRRMLLRTEAGTVRSISAVVVCVLVGTLNAGAAGPPSKCASAEIAAAAKKSLSKAKCWAKATSKGTAV